MYKSNVRGKLYKLTYELNKNTRIKIRTAVGDSDERNLVENVAQGSLDAAIVSSVGLGKGTEDFFKTSEKEVVYGNLKILPMEFMDDISRVCKDPESAQYGNDRLENLAEIKLLDYNLSKCCIIIAGERKSRKKLMEEFELNKPKLGGKEVSIVEHETYLGHELGINVSESITLTLKKRSGLAKRSIYEIVAIVNDFRSKINGGIVTGLHLWESVVIPFVLHNSSTWLAMKKSDIDHLTKLQNLFLSHLLNVQNCPAMMMLWDLGVLPMHLRILKEKLSLYHHVSLLPSSSLMNQVLLTQELFNFPSLRNEIKSFLEEFQIDDVKKFSKSQWKIFVGRKIKELSQRYLQQEMKKYKKVDSLSIALEEFGLKDYFRNISLESSRLNFRRRSQTVTSCRLHYPSEKTNISEEFNCIACTSQGISRIDQISHWAVCESYLHLQTEAMKNGADEALIEFYGKVIQMRKESQQLYKARS